MPLFKLKKSRKAVIGSAGFGRPDRLISAGNHRLRPCFLLVYGGPGWAGKIVEDKSGDGQLTGMGTKKKGYP